MKIHRLLFAFLILATASFGLAQPPPPHNLEGRFHDGKVSLLWHRPNSDVTPSLYKIYRGQDEGYHPGVLASTPDTAYDDTSVESGKTYYYAVTAVYHDTVQSYPSNFIRVSTFDHSGGARVAGFVHDTTGAGIPYVAIVLFDSSRGWFSRFGFTDGSGHYLISSVHPATYFVRADPHNPAFAPQWYDGASEFHDATPVPVHDSDSVTVNFTLHARDTVRHFFTLAGTVSDTAANPIGGARVFAFLLRFDGYGGYDDNHHDCDALRSAQTDSAGHYHMLLPGGTYVVGAWAEHFLPQFWNHRDTPLEADHLDLKSDSSGIDFNLKARSLATGSISGVIRSAKDSTGLISHVVAFHRDHDHHFDGHAAFTRSDSNGVYTLDHLPDGSYLVLAYAGHDYIPTFYSVTGGTAFRDSASTVAVTGSAITGIDIYVLSESEEGLNSISGIISQSSPGSGSTPVDGAIITVTDASNSPVTSALSGSDGSFTATGLATGTYTLLVQKPGLSDASIPVPVDYSNSSPTTTIVNAQLTDASPGSQYTTLSVQPRWNLVSLPSTVADAHRSAVYPTSSAGAFKYTRPGYLLTSVLDYGVGYWIKFPSLQTLNIPGTPRTSQSLTLPAGWNLIGAVSSSVPVSSIATNPPGILATGFFGYSGSYSLATSLEPGKGYWVKLSSGGSLTMTGTSSAPRSENPLSHMNTITVRDASGAEQTLYFGTRQNGLDPAFFEMPPQGPDDALDVRFASQRLVEFVGSGSSTILINSALAPLTLSWSVVQPGGYNLSDASGKLIAAVKGQGSVRVNSKGSLSLAAQPAALPKQFTLYQNYPNPFNPSTQIAFDLPAVSTVTLKVYNLLGQEVATVLDNASFGAGAHSVRFDAPNLSTGVYFYSLRAGSFGAIKKMLIIK